jgi:hypothetical protein
MIKTAANGCVVTSVPSPFQKEAAVRFPLVASLSSAFEDVKRKA